MERNWYAVYTRPLKEKKVASLLAKKGVESFCPIVFMENGASGKKNAERPLFNSYVFVHVTEPEIRKLYAVPGILNVIYWKSKPAVISDREIDIVKKLTANYANIKLEKSFIDVNAAVTVMNEPMIAYNENTVSVKYKSVKVNLPSLGYTMIAERVRQKSTYQQESLIASFPRRLNAFFFN